ncbi:MAG: riboflavin kinase [Patescibacteria group bacterium]|nr:riboflavin kinase [bacterium]MDZ4227555.1 riboflavin kinase [Patescibacteria group bacterium]
MHTYTGIVQNGNKRASGLGFPTVNIPLNDKSASGIYIARVRTEGGDYRAAVYADQKRGLLEAHLLDFSGELYGQAVTMILHKKIRESATFADDETLRTAIENDIAKVRDFSED